ncbi:MAG: hypothetical protein ACK5R0_05210, partial [Bacteroidota bacterium]
SYSLPCRIGNGLISRLAILMIFRITVEVEIFSILQILRIPQLSVTSKANELLILGLHAL